MRADVLFDNDFGLLLAKSYFFFEVGKLKNPEIPNQYKTSRKINQNKTWTLFQTYSIHSFPAPQQNLVSLSLFLSLSLPLSLSLLLYPQFARVPTDSGLSLSLSLSLSNSLSFINT